MYHSKEKTNANCNYREFWIEHCYDDDYYAYLEPQTDKDIHVITYDAYQAATQRIAELSGELKVVNDLLVERNKNAVLAVENYNRINELRNKANEDRDKWRKMCEEMSKVIAKNMVEWEAAHSTDYKNLVAWQMCRDVLYKYDAMLGDKNEGE